ncbi:MAG: hypothetical protein CMP53_06925 [Flavobacteriales bacterium]|nr:hypothetical protein [Flavobacteriales bacterium]|tara:strand:- start:2918 stop:5221 length:2304 start_codon:yes stop_codon:yes gene_type:complete
MKTELFRHAAMFAIYLTSISALGQFYQLSDSLTSQNPNWTGDTAWMNYTNQGLRTNAPSAGSLIWRRPSRVSLDAEWHLNIKMDFNPSSANYCEFRFLEEGSNYYAIQLGGNTSDNLSLMLHTSFKDSVIGQIPNYLNTTQTHVSLKILRDSADQFSIFDDDSLLFTCTDGTLMRSDSLSIYARFTSTRVDKFLFSTLLAEGYDFPDTIGPSIQSCDILNPFSIQVKWNEWCELANGFKAYLLSDGVFKDTLTIRSHFDEYWYLEKSSPIPTGFYEILIPNALDAEGNLSTINTHKIEINYPTPKTCWITAIHPFSSAGVYFIDVQSDQAIANINLSVLEPSGKTTRYTYDLDSGHTRLVNDLRLPEEAVLTIQKDGIILCVQPYKDIFAPHQKLGDFLLVAQSLTGLANQFNVETISSYTPNQVLEANLPNQETIAFFVDSTGQVYSKFSYSVWPYLDLLEPSILSNVFDPERPFLLPAGIRLSKPLGDTTFQFQTPLHSDSTHLFLSEVHFNPNYLDEFIELHNNNSFPVILRDLQLEKNPELGTHAIELIDPDFARYNSQDPLYQLLLPHDFLSLPAPFSLPNVRCSIRLYGRFGALIDQMTYAPWEQELFNRHSAERVSFILSGADTLNWTPHHYSISNPTEASPDNPNSVSQVSLHLPAGEIELSHPHISYDPLNFIPTTRLRILAQTDARLTLSVHSPSGRPITNVYIDQAICAGEQYLEIRPINWWNSKPPSGVYLIKVLISDNQGVSRKILPISIYNPS